MTSEWLQQKLSQTSFSFLDASFATVLTEFISCLLKKNQTINLTQWTSDEDIFNFHILDSLQLLPWIRMNSSKFSSILDLGTGNGFPGLPLSISLGYEHSMTLLDARRKKIQVLQACLATPRFQNIHPLWGRAENLGHQPSYREHWDLIVARAVQPFPVVLEYGIPLLKSGGYLVNWVTQAQIDLVDKSHKALQLLQSKIVEKLHYSLSSSHQPRSLVIVEKLGKTLSTYPRLHSKISNQPL